MRYWLVMPAAGSGRRFGQGLPKQYIEIRGRAVIEWALEPFLEDARCAGIVVALAADDPHWPRLAAGRLARVTTATGGAERSESVRRALRALEGRAAPNDWVLVHDAARPCLPREDVDRLLSSGAQHGSGGGLLALPVSDTLKFAGADGATERTVDRASLWRALTPQMFPFAALCAALDAALGAGRLATDEAQAMEWSGVRPLLVRGSAANIKITTAEDLPLAAALLAHREQASDRTTGEESAMRIGSGIDVHAFGPGEHVMLGGVRVPHTHGVVAHSDGDVILHALCDALLGAAGLGDIGQHFRDDDPQWRGADSSRFVRSVLEMIRTRGFRVINADITVLGEAPRIARHRDEIRSRIGALLELPADCVNIKATTTERLGFLGRREGIAAQAVVALAHA
jgi:2-C-methyl-D-erythritol 4-phosphate cytidylyltransferase/2-C-methyl-D-erythritol 2,4-cyclodiphosphate synthase